MAKANPGESAPAFKVADLTLCEWGRKEIELAEHEMPGLMVLRERFGKAQPRSNANQHRVFGLMNLAVRHNRHALHLQE